jgi:hypothetical protein
LWLYPSHDIDAGFENDPDGGQYSQFYTHNKLPGSYPP